MLWLKAIAAAALLALLVLAVRWCAVTIHKAGERDAAVAHAAQVDREKVELARSFAEAHAADVRISGELADFRGDLGKGLAKFSAELGALPLTHEVPRETLPDGSLAPCRERDPVRYRSLFNSALADPSAP